MDEKTNEIKSKMKITIKIGDESEFTVENISERLSELEEKAEEIAHINLIDEDLLKNLIELWRNKA